ncbi:hypothetical protein QWY15_04940 [Planococcus sp. N064]|uniref:Uncharacterized protein n=1 Tax=Planococcus liqunii TaxID=3058394 RepID=A0ABT8MP17_9BACL|nr:hypothetical protein [Planococcus sp. N064]MDN7226638.1 hypothetical protein [Planococcus sp. N064]
MPSPKDRSDLEGLGAATGQKKSEGACLAPTSAGGLEEMALFAITERPKRPRGAGRRNWTKRKVKAPA